MAVAQREWVKKKFRKEGERGSTKRLGLIENEGREKGGKKKPANSKSEKLQIIRERN